jgi:hypothetical protein
MNAAATPILLLGAAFVLGAGHQARAQLDLQGLARMEGRCHAEIEGRAVTCTGFASFVRFHNGRSAFLFSHEKRLYLLSGSRLFNRDGASFSLRVDTVRIAAEDAPDRAYTDARGDCTVQAAGPAGPYRAIACEARTPGVLAPFRFSFDQISSFETKAYP